MSIEKKIKEFKRDLNKHFKTKDHGWDLKYNLIVDDFLAQTLPSYAQLSNAFFTSLANEKLYKVDVRDTGTFLVKRNKKQEPKTKETKIRLTKESAIPIKETKKKRAKK